MTEDSKQSVRIAVRRPTSTPSIFLVASFTDPAWDPVELEAKPVTSADATSEAYEFSKSFELAPGKYQYKFRAGSGDAWFCDTDVPTEVDNDGNMNNVLLVETASDSKKDDPQAGQSKSDNTTENAETVVASDETTEKAAADKESNGVNGIVAEKADPEPKEASIPAEEAPEKAEKESTGGEDVAEQPTTVSEAIAKGTPSDLKPADDSQPKADI
ncbi:hypothetical protein CIHG_03370 [Coccidioides immitis H538.4]|nr:hypothetical protein CIHG_03370 [Coccidioides immitis H538.4]